MLRYFTINTISELVCLIIAIICVLNDRNNVWKSMVLFLLITCIVEMCGIYIKKLYLLDRQHVYPNAWIYNILLVLQFAFISSMFRYLLNRYKNSDRIFIISGAIFIILYIYDLYTHGFFKYNSRTNASMSVMFVLYGLYYYYQLFKDDQYIRLIYFDSFWWGAGIVLFYFGTTVWNLVYEKLASDMMIKKQQFNHLKYLYSAFNVILYGCWSYSFICRKWLTSKDQLFLQH